MLILLYCNTLGMTAACRNKEQKESVRIHELVSVQQGFLPHKEVKHFKQGFSGGSVVKHMHRDLIPGPGRYRMTSMTSLCATIIKHVL